MRLALLASVFLLTACVLPTGKADDTAVNPISGTKVTVETLDTPVGKPAATPPKPAAPKPAQKPRKAKPLPAPVAGQVDASQDAIAAAEAKAAPADEAVKAQPKGTKEAAKPKAPEETAAEALMPATAAEPETPPELQTPEQARCLKKGGVWATAGKSGAKACVKRTKDAGKSCTKQTQCEGFCLARSRSCAPITPMFGCTDILQADGREVTLCLD
ncbi:MAG: hypothetical protein E6Q73_08335 [Pseudorhodobacter sp.]|nr:MAG: hypothetical protein E6Q73_08335 [Pseudorhodobacter sp.]